MAVLVGLFEISVDRYLTVVKKRALRGNKKTVQNLFVLNLDYVRGLRDVFRGTIFQELYRTDFS